MPLFITEYDQNVVKVPADYGDQITMSKSNLYRMEIFTRWYIPEKKSKACTISFLLDTAEGSMWRIKSTEVKPFLFTYKVTPIVNMLAYVKQVLLKE
jgi:hypothetical protein